jgi:uncharacterized protein (TIGR02246 family)
MEDDERSIRELIDTWMSATKAGDIETVLSLMADDAVFLVAGRPPFGKDEFRKNSEKLAKSSIQFDGKSEILELKVIGDWAYMISRLSVTTNEPGRPATSRSGHTLTVLNKQDGKWLLARDANLLTADSE